MNSLLLCDYMEYLGQQPVSLSGMALMQRSALTEDPFCKEIFRKNMWSLGAFLALQRIENDHLSQELVLSKISADYLEELGFRRSFSEWGNDNIHIEIVSEYINKVIGALYVKTNDGIFIEKNVYMSTAQEWAQWRIAHDEDPSEAELSQAANVASDIAKAVSENELWKIEMDEKAKIEAQRFHRLKELIRDREDMSFWKKLDFLETLSRMPEDKRPFFYALYGVDDGIPKSPEQIAGSFMMKPKQAKQYHQDMLDIHHLHSVTCVSKDPYYDLMEELIGFLLENKENKRVYEDYCERMEKKREQERQRLRKKLESYLD